MAKPTEKHLPMWSGNTWTQRFIFNSGGSAFALLDTDDLRLLISWSGDSIYKTKVAGDFTFSALSGVQNCAVVTLSPEETRSIPKVAAYELELKRGDDEETIAAGAIFNKGGANRDG